MEWNGLNFVGTRNTFMSTAHDAVQSQRELAIPISSQSPHSIQILQDEVKLLFYIL